MKSGYKFDPKTGTMVKESAEIQPFPIIEDEGKAPKFEHENKIVSNNKSARQAINMRRASDPTAVLLVGEDGLPETYLDTVSEDVLMFREREDYDICQISDDRTGKVLAYIGGYALQINFNMAELNTMERIEQCLQGLTKLFRHKIMTQNIKQ